MKGCLFNLIIFTEEKRRTDYFSQIVHATIEKFPSRIIFIQYERNAADELLDISNESSCEQIVIKTSRKSLHKVPFLILPNLVPDLPVYLLWGEDPTAENEIRPYLESLAKRLIFDSECSENLQQFSKKMADKIQSLNVDIMDLDWALIGGWRNVLKNTFSSQEKIEQLNRSHKIEICYNNIPTDLIQHTQTQAIYLQGWLAAQLQWDFQKLENNTITYINDIEISLTPKVNKGFPPGSILSISITSRDDEKSEIVCLDNSSKVMVRSSTREICELPFTLPLPNLQRGLTFIKEIFFYQISDHYLHMLKKISEINWK